MDHFRIHPGDRPSRGVMLSGSLFCCLKLLEKPGGTFYYGLLEMQNVRGTGILGGAHSCL